MRQIVLDTETTGLEPKQGHRIIEIGCVELLNRKLTGNVYHQYIQPEREIDAGAMEVHGITNEFLKDKPRFKDILNDFLTFIKDAELIIHNAPFDVGFINHEFKLADTGTGLVRDYCQVMDTLQLARQMHPGQRNSLDALCKRYDIDNSQREKHGALLDAEILADVYLTMTGGQVCLSLGGMQERKQGRFEEQVHRLETNRSPLKIVRATSEELDNHARFLKIISDASDGNCIWKPG